MKVSKNWCDVSAKISTAPEVLKPFSLDANQNRNTLYFNNKGSFKPF